MSVEGLHFDEQSQPITVTDFDWDAVDARESEPEPISGANTHRRKSSKGRAKTRRRLSQWTEREPGLSDATLDFLITSDGLSKIGERAILLACVLKASRAPKTFRELGARLNCSHTAARGRLSKFRAQIQAELEDFAP